MEIYFKISSKLKVTFLVLFLFVCNLNAQNYLMDGSPITDCEGVFFDSGGSGANYGSNENFTTTICSDNSSGTHVFLAFGSIDLGTGELLVFYDGTDVTAPIIASAADFNGATFNIQATAANASGCLTISFTSDATGSGAGWAAAISCVPQCQTVISNISDAYFINQSNSMHVPAIEPVDTGWIDLCVGDRVYFTGEGIYPQNDLIYNQSDATSIFQWEYGDGSFSYGLNGSHVYAEAGGYIVQFHVTDVQGCTNSNIINQRVRVSGRPSFNVGGDVPDQICVGDTITLAGITNTIDTAYNVSIIPDTGSFSHVGILSDTLNLPDGAGTAYESSILLNDFSPGQVLTDANDFIQICAIMEHSFLADISVTLIAPDGTAVVLEASHNGWSPGGVFLGEPVDLSPDNSVPGVGYEYCWSASATNGTWFQYINNGGATPNNTLPPGVYGTEDPISDFIGVPLNGEWTISVLDDWGIDDGWIFQWYIEFNEDLYPNIETYVNYIVDHHWNTNPSIIFYDPDSIIAFPQNAGLAQYFYEIRDTFGCVYDTSVLIPVLPPTHPDCHRCDSTYTIANDTSICDPTPINLAANYETILMQDVGFETFPIGEVSYANTPPPAPFESEIEVTSLNPSTLNDINDFIKVCVDIETDFDGDIEIWLVSPSGTPIELSTRNGSSGDNYENTCFTVNALTNITAGSPPFLGDYTPEGNFNDLVGGNVNGIWTLQVSDRAGLFGVGTLNAWSIHFNTYNDVNYQWTSTETVVCPTCDTTISTPLNDADYILNITDIYNCQFEDTVSVQLGASAPAPVLACDSMSGGNIYFTWDMIAGATGYSININNAGWMNFGLDTNNIVPNLNEGDSVNLQITALGVNMGTCIPDTSALTCVYNNCNLSLEIADTTQVSCFGGNDGAASITAMMANLPATYSIDNGPTQNTGIFNGGLMAGLHQVIVIDNEGCTDSISFTLMEPTEMVLSSIVDSVSCFNGSDGSAVVTVVGGTGPTYNYVWNTFPAQQSDTLTDVTIGNYIVTVQDMNGCSSFDTVDIFQPTDVVVVPTVGDVTCFGTNTGSIDLMISGGHEPYTSQWSGPNAFNSTDVNISDLEAGLYAYTVTDANQCTKTNSILVRTPSQINISDTTHTPVTCFGGMDGTATVIPMVDDSLNIQNPLTILWENTETSLVAHNLPVGPISCTVTDANNCSVTFTVTVTGPATAVSLDTFNLMHQSCFGYTDANVQLTPNNAVLPVAYSLDNGPSQMMNTYNNLTTGLHQVIMTDNLGCMDSIDFEVTEPTQIMLTTMTDSVSCFGGSDGGATVSVMGGTPNTVGEPYSYLWNTLPAQVTSNLSGVPIGIYNVAVSDANSCSEIAMVEVFQPSALQVNSMIQNVQCWYAEDGSIEIEISGGLGPYETHWEGPNAFTSENEDISGLATGNYAYTVTDNNGCMSMGDMDITSPPAIDTLNTSSTPVSCYGGMDGTATIIPSGGAGVLNVLWDNLETSLVAHNLSAGLACGIVTDGNGCTVNFCVDVASPDSLSLTISSESTSCFNSMDGTASVVASGGTVTSGYSYLWDNNVTTAAAFGFAPGNHCVTVTDDNNCFKSICIDVLAADSLIIDSLVVDPTLCFDTNSGSAEVFVHGGTGNHSYQWSQGLNTNNNPVADLAYGNVLVTVTDANACSVVATGNVDRPDALAVNFNTQDIFCFGGNTGVLTAIPSGGTGPYAFNWSNSETGPIIDSLTVGNYTVTITDANSCEMSASASIISPNSEIVLELTQTNIPCFGASNGEGFAQATGGDGNFTYTWNDDLSQVGATADSLATDFYIVVATDGLGCSTNKTLFIEQYDSIIAHLVLQNPTCYGVNDGRITMDQIMGGAGQGFMDNYDYTWSTIPQVHLNVLNQILGDSTYYLSIVDNKGCNTVVSGTLGEPSPIMISETINNALCFGSDDGIIEVKAEGDIDSFIYSWGPNTGNFVGDSIGGLLANDYIVTATDTNGCHAIKIITVDQPEALSGQFDVRNVNCNGGADGALLMTGSGGTPNYNYLWGDSTMVNTISNLSQGTYYLTMTDRNDCVFMDSITITQPTVLSMSLTADDVTCNGGHDGFIYINSSGGVEPYVYSLDGDDFNGSSTQIGLEAGTYDVFVMDNNGCLDTNVIYIDTPPIFTIDLGEDHTIQFEGSTVLAIDNVDGVQGSIISYNWINESPDSIICQGALCENALVMPLFTSTYHLAVQDEFGCIAEDIIKVIVEQGRGVHVPTGFSPNGDFLNDLLLVHGKPETVVLNFNVFDKWGEKIYEDGAFLVNDTTKGWNGTYKGEIMPPGVYLYTLEVQYKDGFVETLKGATTLIR